MNEETRLAVIIGLQACLQQLRYPHQVLSEAFLSARPVLPAAWNRADWLSCFESLGLNQQQVQYVLSTVFCADFQKDAESRAERGVACGIRAVLPGEPDYPVPLSAPLQLPPFLYIRGRLSMPPPETCISVIGTRRPSPYGIKATRSLVTQWARLGITIVSGLARGIDGLAHEICLKAYGQTVAVLGTGADICYPHQNRAIFEQVALSGLLISEYPPKTPPRKHHFPARNRLISVLSNVLVVIEATRRSGTLITTNFALDQGREVLALPGNIYSPTSTGTNHLLREGAVPLLEAEDVLPYLSPELPFGPGRPVAATANPESSESPVEQSKETAPDRLLELLTSGPLTVNELKLKSRMENAEFFDHLMWHEMRGEIAKHSGKYHLA